MSNLRSISKNQYYKIIKQWHDEHGKSPTKEDFNNNLNLPSSRTLEENLKTPWNIALKDLGLEQIQDRTYYLLMNNDELLEAFKKEYLRILPNDKKNFNNKRNKIFPNNQYIEKKLGLKWNDLLNLCGFSTTRGYYTKEQFTKILKKLYKELGHTPSITEFEKNYTLGALLRAFNLKTYNEVINLLKFETNKTPEKCNLMDGELINKYKDLCSSLGKVATAEDINNDENIPSFEVYMHRFTTIKNLRKLASITGGREKRDKYTTDYIIKVLKHLYKENNGRLTTAELQLKIKENKYPTISTMQKHLKVNSLSNMWDKVENYKGH